MYVATQHRDDPNVFYVTPVTDSGVADTDGTIVINLGDDAWWTGMDEATKAQIEEAIGSAKQQVSGDTGDSSGSAPVEDSVDPFAEFNQGFGRRQTPSWVTGTQGAFRNKQTPSWVASMQGAAWDNYSPTARMGGFHPQGSMHSRMGMTAEDYRRQYVDSWRESQGLPPRYGQQQQPQMSYEDAKRMAEETAAMQSQERERLRGPQAMRQRGADRIQQIKDGKLFSR